MNNIKETAFDELINSLEYLITDENCIAAILDYEPDDGRIRKSFTDKPTEVDSFFLTGGYDFDEPTIVKYKGMQVDEYHYEEEDGYWLKLFIKK